MKRKAIVDLIKWKNDIDRKPLVIRGARQVGKTWLMKEFGKNYYDDYIYLNFDENEEIKSIFLNNKNPKRIIELLSLIFNKPILPNKTLIIFDEIQECPEALNSLKYFKENANEYHVICAGSLLGTLLARPKSYPVGMVNLLNLYPLTYAEFLETIDENMYKYYLNIKKNDVIEDVFHNRLLDIYNLYLIIGGMPEVVYSWIKYHDYNKIMQIQNELITIYENDFSKHNNKVNSAKLLLIFRGIVSQLAKDNEKFIYSALKEGARAREYEEAIEWLVSAGIINRIYNVSKLEHPLNAFKKLDQFKVFLFDTGLLKYMAGIENESLLLQLNYQFKGQLTENYVLQQLKDMFLVEIAYYSNRYGEIDFVIQKGMDIIPIEVKAGENKSAPVFKNYVNKEKPKTAIRFSKLNYKKDGLITNIPLYLVDRIKDLL